MDETARGVMFGLIRATGLTTYKQTYDLVDLIFRDFEVSLRPPAQDADGDSPSPK